MMNIIRNGVLVLFLCSFVQMGFARAESELSVPLEDHDLKRMELSMEREPVKEIGDEDPGYRGLSEALSIMTVRNLNDRAVALEALWEDRRVVLVFMRHFGCLFVRQQVAALVDVKEQLDEMGVAVVAIGSGDPDQAKTFIEKFGFEGEMYLDPSLSVYQAFGLNRGFWRTLGPSSLVRGAVALARGFRQGGTAGDRWQQGGVFVLGPGNRLLFQHRNRSAGDNAAMDDVLKACALP